MLYTVNVPPYRKECITYKAHYSEFPEYDLLTVGKESYLAGDIENSDEGHSVTGRMIHNFQIGNFCSIASEVHFLIGRGKDFNRVSTSAAKILQSAKNIGERHHEKGSIIIKNDVWLGRKVSVMSGVTINNGAIVAAHSHVVKDVPPYAIVGGNPAKVIGYRFPEEIISKFQKIQWWNWSEQKIAENAEFFSDDVYGFCNRFYQEALDEILETRNHAIVHSKDTYLMLLDFGDNYSVVEYVLDEFIQKWYNDKNKKLELFSIGKSPEEKKYVEGLKRIIESLYEDSNLQCEICIEVGDMETVKRHLVYTNHIVINRNVNTVLLMDYAEKYGENIEIISGVDVPIFLS